MALCVPSFGDAESSRGHVPFQPPLPLPQERAPCLTTPPPWLQPAAHWPVRACPSNRVRMGCCPCSSSTVLAVCRAWAAGRAWESTGGSLFAFLCWEGALLHTHSCLRALHGLLLRRRQARPVQEVQRPSGAAAHPRGPCRPRPAQPLRALSQPGPMPPGQRPWEPAANGASKGTHSPAMRLLLPCSVCQQRRPGQPSKITAPPTLIHPAVQSRHVYSLLLPAGQRRAPVLRRRFVLQGGSSCPTPPLPRTNVHACHTVLPLRVAVH